MPNTKATRSFKASGMSKAGDANTTYPDSSNGDPLAEILDVDSSECCTIPTKATSFSNVDLAPVSRKAK